MTPRPWFAGALRLVLPATLLAALLAGCAASPVRAPAPALAGDALDARLRERDAWIARTEAWGFAGKAGISRAGKGGSGRIEWDQRAGGAYDVALSAPITRQSWRLSGDLATGAARIDGLSGGVREGRDAEALLESATGWRVPLRLLGAWVRGAVAPGVPAPAIDYDAQGRPVRFEQAGWTVRYLEWRPGPPGAPDLPVRIDAESGDARVRLVIDDWIFASP